MDPRGISWDGPGPVALPLHLQQSHQTQGDDPLLGGCCFTELCLAGRESGMYGAGIRLPPRVTPQFDITREKSTTPSAQSAGTTPK